MDPQNSAVRLHSIVMKATKVQSKSALELWSEVFGLAAISPQALMIEAAQRLVWVDSELNALITFLKTKKNYPEQGYLSVQSGIRNAASPHLLGSLREHVVQHLKPDVVASLYQMALNLPDEEERIAPEELSAFENVLNELASRLSEPEIGAFLSGVLHRHIRLLRRALDAYPIWGVRAFSDSLRDALGDLFLIQELERSGDDISAEARSTVLTLKSLWKKVGSVVTEVDKAKKLVTLVGQAHAALSWAGHHILS